MKVDSITDIGLVRAQNEDDVKTGLLEDAAWAVVCDGMGGANAGEVASQNGVQVISDGIRKNYYTGANDKVISYVLRTAVSDANTVIFNLSEAYEHLSGMGTTAVAAIVAHGVGYICHVGDSRAYLIREDSIRCITKDHSVVQQLIDAGTLTEAEAKVHPQRNIITRCLGVHPHVETDSNEVSLESGDMLLLCTDGLTNYLTEDEILEFSKRLDPSALIRALVEEAKQRGGSDNITAAVIEN